MSEKSILSTNFLVNVDGRRFEVCGIFAPIVVADSFVLRQNKTGSGNGEAKLYVGQEGKEVRAFFGTKPIRARCFIRKQDLIQYLKLTEIEYRFPTQEYRFDLRKGMLWESRYRSVSRLEETIWFTIEEQTQIVGPRVYVKSEDPGYELIRELSLPNRSKLGITRLRDESGEIIYYFRLFPEQLEDGRRAAREQAEVERIRSREISDLERESLITARVGQGRFRVDVLRDCVECPITRVNDERLLVASHIKPWVDSQDDEKLDCKNGLALTPTFDRLFDRGFLSFSESGAILLSPWIEVENYKRVGLNVRRSIDSSVLAGREDYFDFHRRNVFKA